MPFVAGKFNQKKNIIGCELTFITSFDRNCCLFIVLTQTKSFPGKFLFVLLLSLPLTHYYKLKSAIMYKGMPMFFERVLCMRKHCRLCILSFKIPAPPLIQNQNLSKLF